VTVRLTYSRRATAAVVAVVLAALLPAHTSARAAAYPDSQQVRLLAALQEDLYNDRYDAAEKVARLMVSSYPDDPLGHLFTGITLVTAAYDAEEALREREFRTSLAAAERLAGLQIASGDRHTRAWGFLVLGHAASYRAVWEAKFGSKLTAARAGRTAAGLYERGLRADSTVYDLYFGLGLYHYWKSAKAGVLRWLGIVSDDKERGLRELETAAEGSLISREAARSSLVWVRLDRKEYREAVALGDSLMRRYPHSRSFLWPVAEAQYRLGRYADAAAAYGRLREMLREEPGNYYNLIECDYRIARCFEMMGLPGEWAGTAADVSGYMGEVSEETQERQRERLEYLGVAGE